jgi:hypothetical protein
MPSHAISSRRRQCRRGLGVRSLRAKAVAWQRSSAVCSRKCNAVAAVAGNHSLEMQRRTPDFADSFREGVRSRIESAFIAQPLLSVIRLTLVRTAVSRIWSAVGHLRRVTVSNLVGRLILVCAEITVANFLTGDLATRPIQNCEFRFGQSGSGLSVFVVSTGILV